MSLPFLELPPLCSTPARPISHSSMINSSTINRTATGQPSLLPLQPLLNSNDANSGRYTLAPLVSNHASANTGSSHHYGKVPVTPGGQMITLPFTPSPTCNIARNANSTFTRTTSCFSIGSNTSNNSTMATPPSDDSADDLPVSPEQSIRLAGLKPPARYPGALPESFSRQDPVPGDESDNEDDESKKQKGAPSQNPWDYMRPLKKKERRRFTRRELEAIETLWWVEKAPNKYQRQRIGAWLGVKTKHITVWFQNKRQESKKHAKEQQETLDKSVKQDLEDTKTETHRPRLHHEPDAARMTRVPVNGDRSPLISFPALNLQLRPSATRFSRLPTGN
ncbi:hypothetical protein BD324DRAFT_74856 [Kockovaella imperatae]|uniref:Homeobox domain-containing protein n=1 Tax=Kockovaella imperatae TaxID=4999 RepID=A0A1Y1UF92_9TREE|nr:hypothetical protein BD324DRAFT_74856 [Kockovaella imperatae]ORX35745.1 hypothetical protein BD324DRAFT_74856 [Kockovaella imperatae]